MWDMLESLRAEIEHLKASLGLDTAVEHEPELDFDEAKDKIAELFQTQGRLAYSDLIRALGLDLDTVIAACDELVEEGRICEAK